MSLKLTPSVAEWDLPLTHEAWLLNMFSGLRGDTFIDVGAHIGTWTLNLAQNFKNVVAFEPNSSAYLTLRDNVELNNIENVRVIRRALGASVGARQLSLFEQPSRSTLYPQFTKHTPVDLQEVRMSRLDDYLFDNVSFVKIDVEGGEVEVLQGAFETLKRCMPAYCIEIHSDALYGACEELLLKCRLPPRVLMDVSMNTDQRWFVRI